MCTCTLLHLTLAPPRTTSHLPRTHALLTIDYSRRVVMFNQFAQRLVPSFGRSAAMHQGCRGAFSMLGRKSMMSTSASVFGKRLPEKSIQVNSLSSIFSRSLVINSRSVAVPSSLTPSSPCTVVGSTLALQTRGFASKKVCNGC